MKTCNICQMKIKEKEAYLRLTCYSKGKETSTSYYHEFCFRRRFMNQKELQDKAMNLIGRTDALLKRGEKQWL